MNSPGIPVKVLLALVLAPVISALAGVQDLDLGPQWEFNFGVGVGLTGAIDHWIIKCILGRRFSWTREHGPRLKASKDH
jgi:hypothetical protein